MVSPVSQFIATLSRRSALKTSKQVKVYVGRVWQGTYQVSPKKIFGYQVKAAQLSEETGTKIQVIPQEITQVLKRGPGKR
jgi:hypothetical protein